MEERDKGVLTWLALAIVYHLQGGPHLFLVPRTRYEQDLFFQLHHTGSGNGEEKRKVNIFEVQKLPEQKKKVTTHGKSVLDTEEISPRGSINTHPCLCVSHESHG